MSVTHLQELGLDPPTQSRPEALTLLHQFNIDGKRTPGSKKDELLVKMLLAYRLLDVAAFMYGRGSELHTVQKSASIPFMEKLVLPSPLCPDFFFF